MLNFETNNRLEWIISKGSNQGKDNDWDICILSMCPLITFQSIQTGFHAICTQMEKI